MRQHEYVSNLLWAVSTILVLALIFGVASGLFPVGGHRFHCRFDQLMTSNGVCVEYREVDLDG